MLQLFVLGITLTALYFILEARKADAEPVVPDPDTPDPEPPAEPSPSSPPVEPDPEPEPEEPPNTPFPEPSPEPEPEPTPEEPEPDNGIPEGKFGVKLTGIPGATSAVVFEGIPAFDAEYKTTRFAYFVWGDIKGGSAVNPDGFNVALGHWPLDKIYLFDLQKVLERLPVDEKGTLSGIIEAYNENFDYPITFKYIYSNQFLPKSGKLYEYNISESKVRLI